MRFDAPRQDAAGRLGEALRAPYRIRTEADLDLALASLVKLDRRLGRALSLGGRPPLRKRPVGFSGLASIVVSQQLSTASAKAIWSRLEAALDPIDHATILRARPSTLARTGLSAAKIRTLKAIAHAVRSGDLDLAALATLPPEQSLASLTSIHGIGPWTADVYLLFCLGHADAWPAGDLALQEAMRLLFRLRTRPSARQMVPLAEPWRPWRGAAACVLWSYYRAVKQRDGAPAQADRRRAGSAASASARNLRHGN